MLFSFSLVRSILLVVISMTPDVNGQTWQFRPVFKNLGRLAPKKSRSFCPKNKKQKTKKKKIVWKFPFNLLKES